MSYLEIANSTGMWLVCSVIIFVVIFQAAVFMRKAYKTGKEMGLSDEQMQSAMRSGAISTVGPFTGCSCSNDFADRKFGGAFCLDAFIGSRIDSLRADGG